MISKDYRSNFKLPVHSHKGKNYFRYFSLLLLISSSVLSIIAILNYGLVFLPFLLGSFFGICCVRFPSLKVYDDCFVIERRGLLEKFNDFDLFKYKDIESVEFSKGFTDWSYIIVLALLGSGQYFGAGGNNKADQMIIKTIEDKTSVFNRFGSRKDFVSTIDLIKKGFYKNNGNC